MNRCVPKSCVADEAPSRGKILIVDDDQINRAFLARFLCSRELDVIEAKNANQAFEAVASTSVDMVLLDIAMPGLDGLGVLARLREAHSEIELPIMMVTANEDKQQILKAFEFGANDYLTKPIDVDVALVRIEIQLKLQRAQAALQASEERFALAAMGANDGLWDWDLVNDRIYFSPRWRSLLGISDDETFEGKDAWFSKVCEEDRQRLQQELRIHLLSDADHFETQFRITHNTKGNRWMSCRGMAVRDANGKATRIAGSLTDIHEGKVPDALTGLPNRRLFRDHLRRSVDRRFVGEKKGLAVLFLDLDKFKEVNDEFGHQTGDLLLVAVASRLQGFVRSTDAVVARMGGDEFTILLNQLPSRQVAERIAQGILNLITQPFQLADGNTVSVSASIGLNYSADGHEDIDELIRNADTAMYEVKSNRQANVHV